MDERRIGPRRVPEDRSEGFGERLLGQMLDRSHELPPQLIAPLVAEEVARIGGRDVSIHLQDYALSKLVPLRGRRLTAGEPPAIDGSPEGDAFLGRRMVEESQADGLRVHVPLVDGADEVGVLSITLDTLNDDDRRLLRRLSALIAEMIISKTRYTDQFFMARRHGRPLSLAAEIQYAQLPPLAMHTPQVSLAAALEPAYEVAGDGLDYALNDDLLHLAIIDAMGHGLEAAMLATLALGAHRRGRRMDVGLRELYELMDRSINGAFGPEQFVTAQMMRLNVSEGHLQWINAGHPAPLLIRGHRVIDRLESAERLPMGFGFPAPPDRRSSTPPGGPGVVLHRRRDRGTRPPGAGVP
ncbi:protein serine/threonine phosphatase [Streptomyces viridochromogenes DSM 40736]|uniref:Protein serine/threonine phosphatase n=1 Tax=Streptomyces viridochromogenes (strain DSM 40736 / JCM 4977 / BCRC 1201 / Tue 494) TaxID=591159 RepID=D9XCC9_STRVT|nr:protein serine/threonine phosphatase [Streptomyces viridochromogenes DSM 40736]